MTTDTLKQAAQALRGTIGARRLHEIAAALEAMAEQKPDAWITTISLDGKHTLDLGCTTSNPDYVRAHKEWRWEPLYAAPITTPEHDAQVRDAARWRWLRERLRMFQYEDASIRSGISQQTIDDGLPFGTEGSFWDGRIDAAIKVTLKTTGGAA